MRFGWIMAAAGFSPRCTQNPILIRQSAAEPCGSGPLSPSHLPHFEKTKRTKQNGYQNGKNKHSACEKEVRKKQRTIQARPEMPPAFSSPSPPTPPRLLSTIPCIPPRDDCDHGQPRACVCAHRDQDPSTVVVGVKMPVLQSFGPTR